MFSISIVHAMGQIFGIIQDILHGKGWKNRKLRLITDRVFDLFKDETGKVNLSFIELYNAVLLIYNDINKYLPGPHFDPPSKAQMKAMMKEYDTNLDGELDREEFTGFIQKLAAETLTKVSHEFMVAVVVAPTVAIATKKATEGLPGVGKMVHRVPTSICASLATLGVVFFQNSSHRIK